MGLDESSAVNLEAACDDTTYVYTAYACMLAPHASTSCQRGMHVATATRILYPVVNLVPGHLNRATRSAHRKPRWRSDPNTANAAEHSVLDRCPLELAVHQLVFMAS